MNQQAILDAKGVASFLVEHEGSILLIDAVDRVAEIVEKIEKSGGRLVGIVLTGASLEIAARAGELQSRWEIPVWAHRDALPGLQRLPALAEVAGLCGVRVPQVGHYLRPGQMNQIGPFRVDVSEQSESPAGSVKIRIDAVPKHERI